MRKPARERRKNEEEECFLRKPSTCVTMKPTNLAIPALSTTRSTKITKKKKRKKKPKLQLAQWESGRVSAHQLQLPQRAAAVAVDLDQRPERLPRKRRQRRPREKLRRKLPRKNPQRKRLLEKLQRKSQPRKKPAKKAERRAQRKKADVAVARILFQSCEGPQRKAVAFFAGPPVDSPKPLKI